MTVELKQLDNGRLLEVHLTGKLVKKDYKTLLPAVDRRVQQHGKINMLVDMHDFHELPGSGSSTPYPGGSLDDCQRGPGGSAGAGQRSRVLGVSSADSKQSQ